jgi:hypothetical protein
MRAAVLVVAVAYVQHEVAPEDVSLLQLHATAGAQRYAEAALDARDVDLAACAAERGVPTDGERKDVAFASIFSFAKDPQRGTVYARDDVEHIKKWMDSIQNLDMNGVVLHDEVYSAEFAKQHSTAKLQFHYVNVTEKGLYTNPDLVKLTTSDYRFIALSDYLTEHKDDLGYVLLTDAHDVEFRRNPFLLMRSLDGGMGFSYVYGQEEWRPRVPLFPGSADANLKHETAISRLVGYYHSCFKEDMPADWTFGRMPNCGILGGHVTVVSTFLGRMRHWYAKIPQEDRFLMCDMLVYMRVVMEDYQDRFVSGYPLHAKFKNGDKHEFAAIYHKHDIPKEEPKEELPAASSMSLLQVDRHD